MRFLAIIFTLFTLNSSAQWVPAEGEACWCYPSEYDSLGNVEALKAITYPLPVKKNNMWGAVDKEGDVVAEFKSQDPFLLTPKGKVILKNFEWHNHQWDTSKDSYLSLLDSAGNEAEKYHVQDIYKGSFIASKDKKNWGLLNSEMKILVPFEYIPAHHEGEQFEFSSKGYWSTRENKAGSLFGAFDFNGRTIIPFKWKLISYVIEDEDHIYVMNDYLKRGYINIKGQTTLSFIYEKIPRVVTDSNLVKTEDYLYFLDSNLKRIGPRYQAFEKKGDLWFYKVSGKWGIMDENYQEVIAPTYSSIMDGPRIRDNSDFKCYIVVKNGKYGLITLDGEAIISPKYPCLCGLGYYAPSAYYIEFQNEAGVSYKYNEKGELLEKGGKSGGNCFCE